MNRILALVEAMALPTIAQVQRMTLDDEAKLPPTLGAGTAKQRSRCHVTRWPLEIAGINQRPSKDWRRIYADETVQSYRSFASLSLAASFPFAQNVLHAINAVCWL